jgi:PAS domain S-box-containing protein
MSSKKVPIAKKAIIETHEELVIDRLPLGIMILDEKGAIRFVNKNIADQMNKSQDDLIDSLIYDILEPSSIPDVLSILRSEKKYSRQQTLILNPPSGRSVHGIFSFEEYPLGNKPGFMMVMLEHKVRVMKREIGYEALEELPIPITIVDRELEPVFQNSATDEWINLLSKGKDPITKSPKFRREKLMECFANGATVTYTIKIKTQEEPFEFDVTAVPLPSRERPDQAMEIWLAREQKDEVKGGTGAKDIGEELIETSNAIIIGLDLEGNIQLFNTGATRALGYVFDEVKGTSWFDYLLDRDMDRGKLEVFQWSISSGFRTQYEVRVRSKSGSALTISLENTVIFDEEGNVSMVLMVGQDFTEMKRLETSLREQGVKLVEAIDEVSLYNDLMIHDIHNANAGIMGYLELINIGSMNEEKRKNYIMRALKEVKKSSSIIKDVKLMSLARPISEPVPINLVSVFKNVIERTGIEGSKKGIQIDVDVGDIEISGDELIEEALLRVIENSVYDIGDKKARITIEAKRDPSKSNLVPEPVHITIGDDRGEVSEEQFKTVMERPRRTDLGSHGLGLYLVKKIIDRYGGMVWVEKVKEGDPGLVVHILLKEAI